jgi:PAS domain S-box-containing protein
MDAIISVDAEQRIVLFNTAAERIFRCPASAALGQHIEGFIPARWRAAHRKHMAAFGATGVTSRSIGALETFRGLRADGEEFPIEASISHIEAARHELYTVIIRDVTERQRLEQARQSLQEELEERVRDRTAELEAANRELEAFSYSVSHDLRSPLRHIGGFVNLLSRREEARLDATSARYVQVIAESVHKMGQLIDDLLAFARLERVALRRRLVESNALVTEALQELAPALEERCVVWQIAALPAVQGDPSLLRLVWVNLLDNAIKYTASRAEARIEVGSQPSAQGDTVFFVRDNGVGFDMQYADRLFGVFQRLHRDDAFPGTGIGLATVRRILHRHGGRIWADSAVDHGTTFFFTIGAVSAGADAAGEPGEP